MAYFSKALVAVLASAGLAATAAAAGLRANGGQLSGTSGQDGAVIPSNEEGALDRPELWDCDRINPEYRDWLEDGNSADSWKFVGKTYRDVETGKNYNWQDWLDWLGDSGCGAGAIAENGLGVPTTNAMIGAGITALGTGLLIASFGSNAKSPG